MSLTEQLCQRPGCKNTFIPVSCHQKYCKDPECTKKRNSDGWRRLYLKNKDKPPAIAETRESHDRGTEPGFRKYMEENPVYFQDIFPGMTIAEAWGECGIPKGL